MNIKDFDINFMLQRQNEIDLLISEILENPCHDGIIDIQNYTNTSIKVLWILKEVNDEDNYNHRDTCRNLSKKVLETNSLINTNRRAWWPTLDPVIYISYQILNNFSKWKDISYIKDMPSMVGTLNRIAFINIKKDPGGAVSIEKELYEAYAKAREIIRQQIDLINPDIVICGNTLQYLSDDYNLKSLTNIPGYPLNYLKSTDRLFIDSYHPQFLSRQNEDYKGEYFDEIIDIIEKWWNERAE